MEDPVSAATASSSTSNPKPSRQILPAMKSTPAVTLSSRKYPDGYSTKECAWSLLSSLPLSVREKGKLGTTTELGSGSHREVPGYSTNVGAEAGRGANLHWRAYDGVRYRQRRASAVDVLDERRWGWVFNAL